MQCITRITDPYVKYKDYVFKTTDDPNEAKKWFEEQILTLRVIGHGVYERGICLMKKGTI